MKGEADSGPRHKENEEPTNNHFVFVENVRIENGILAAKSIPRFKWDQKGT